MEIDGLFRNIKVELLREAGKRHLAAGENFGKAAEVLAQGGNLEEDPSFAAAVENSTKAAEIETFMSDLLANYRNRLALQLTSLGIKVPRLEGEEIEDKEAEQETPQTPIEVLDLSSATYNALKRSQIKTVEQILQMSEDEFRGIRHMGQKRIIEVKEKMLAQPGIKLNQQAASGGRATPQFLGEL